MGLRSCNMGTQLRTYKAACRAPALLPAFRKPGLHIAHFRQGPTVDLQSEVVRLPLEGQELLGLRRSELLKDSELNSVYEQLVGAAVEPGYTESVSAGRLEVLDYVRRELISTKGRARESRELTLPLDLLPGALALMTEVGQCQLVLDIGSELLSMSEPVPVDVRRDVLLSVALANCGLASESLVGSTTQLAKGCGYLEAALQHLEAAGEPPLAPTLAAQIRQGLASLRVQGAMEQLSGPLDASTAEARKRAIRVVRDAIRTQSAAAGQQPPDALGLGLGRAVGGARGMAGSAGASGAATASGSAMTPELMETLMSLLTCEEVVELAEWEQVAQNPTAHKWMYPGLLEGVGVAHVIHGFVCRQPAYIKIGLGLVQQLPSSPDLCVVEGVCHVLLGGINQAAAALKRAERPGKAADRPAEINVADGALPASRDAYQFVVASSAGSGDGLLPGLCLFTERWLTQAAFPFFRDTACLDAAPASLVKYFDDTRVETLLTVYDAKSGGQLAETLSEAFAAIRRGLREASGAAPAQGEEADAVADTGLASRQNLFRAVAGSVALVAAVAVGLMTPPGQRLLGRGEGAQMAVVAHRAPLQPLTVAPEEFDSVVAKRLLEHWQSAKAWALGPYHSTDQLDVLLAEPMLGETLDKVATLRSHGAHMRFKLLRLEVLGVKHVSGKAGPSVRISALLEDSADLHNDADGKPVNTCRRTYDAEYTVGQGKDGAWRITSTTMVEREGRK